MNPNEHYIPATTNAIMHDLGARIAKIRLSRNLTQAHLAQETGASISSIKRLEIGKNVSLDTLIRVLSALGMNEHLSNMLPNPDIRPVERVSRQGHERQRARKRTSVTKASDWAWHQEEGE